MTPGSTPGHAWDQLRELPTGVEVGGQRYHESLLRGRRVLNRVREMLERGDSKDTILEFIAFAMDSRLALPLAVEDERAQALSEGQTVIIARLRRQLAEVERRLAGVRAVVDVADQAELARDERELGDPGA